MYMHMHLPKMVLEHNIHMHMHLPNTCIKQDIHVHVHTHVLNQHVPRQSEANTSKPASASDRVEYSLCAGIRCMFVLLPLFGSVKRFQMKLFDINRCPRLRAFGYEDLHSQHLVWKDIHIDRKLFQEELSGCCNILLWKHTHVSICGSETSA
jgi:hypothetical protein